MVVTRSWIREGQEREEDGQLFNGYTESVVQGEKLLGIGCTTIRIFLTQLNCMLKMVTLILCYAFYHNQTTATTKTVTFKRINERED